MLDTEIRTNPFPGLRAFEQDEEYLFFGREKQIDELLKKLRTTRFLSVIGSSGSGKSSLVKSGLLPSLYSGYMTSAGSSWRVAIFRPGNDPIGNLAQVLSEQGILYDHDDQDSMYTSIIEATLRRSRLGLLEAVKQSELTKDENLLVIVDQFEELFRYSKYEEQTHGEKQGSQAFINLLLNSINHEEANIYIGLTMRSDFLGECTQFRNLPEAINEGQYLIPRMTRDDIKQAITGPIAVSGSEITPRLLTRLLNDVGDSPDQLPILQHSLMRTWDYWEQNHKEGEPIDLVHYEAIGTMSKALSLHAEEALSELPNEESKALAEVLFKSLTDHGGKGQGIRRPTMLSEICDLANAPLEKVVTVIESFRKKGRSLLMPPIGTPLIGSTIIDISHESLMRIWTRLKKWDEEESVASETYLRLANDAAMYQEGKMGLLGGPELQLALKWKEENQPNEKWARRYNPSFERAMSFLEHSKKQNDFNIAQKEMEQKRRLVRARRTIIIFGCAAIFFLFMMLYAFQLREEANTERRRADEEKIEANLQKTEADRQRSKAEENELVAKDQTKRAEDALVLAELAEDRALLNFEAAVKAQKEALASKREADLQRDKAVDSRVRAEEAEKTANELYQEAEQLRIQEEEAKLQEIAARKDADNQRLKAETLRNLADSRNESFRALQEINEGDYENGAKMAIHAHKLNIENNGPYQNGDNYRALSAALNGLQPDKQTLNIHKQSVRAIALNDTHGLIASGDDDGKIYISKLIDGAFEQEMKLSAPGAIRTLSFSARGNYLLAGTYTKHLAVWDVNHLTDGKSEMIIDKTYAQVISALACVNFLGDDYVILSTGNRLSIEKITPNGLLEIKSLPLSNVEAITISDDQKTLLLASNDDLYEYKLNDPALLSNPTITKLQAPIVSIAMSANNEYTAVGLLYGKIYIKDNQKGNQEGKYFTEHHSRVSSLDFYDFGSRIQLTSTGYDKTIKMMDVKYLLYQGESGEDKITINGHDKWIRGGHYSSDGKYYLTIGEDQKVKSWHSNTGDIVKSIEKILDKGKK